MVPGWRYQKWGYNRWNCQQTADYWHLGRCRYSGRKSRSGHRFLQRIPDRQPGQLRRLERESGDLCRKCFGRNHRYQHQIQGLYHQRSRSSWLQNRTRPFRILPTPKWRSPRRHSNRTKGPSVRNISTVDVLQLSVFRTSTKESDNFSFVRKISGKKSDN